MQTIATLDPSVRLIVFKFLIKSGLVPDIIPRLSIQRSNTIPMAQGRQVLVSTPDIWLAQLVLWLSTERSYKFVGARTDDSRADGRSDVRFTFCHQQHLKDRPLHPDFLAIEDRLHEALAEISTINLWSVEGYLNPYLQEDGTIDDGNVLMLDCNGRRQAILDGKPIKVYQGGREKIGPGITGPGIGPKVNLIDIAKRAVLIGNDIRLVSGTAS